MDSMDYHTACLKYEMTTMTRVVLFNGHRIFSSRVISIVRLTRRAANKARVNMRQCVHQLFQQLSTTMVISNNSYS